MSEVTEIETDLPAAAAADVSPTSELASAVAAAFAEGGALSRANPGYLERSQQQQMAQAVAEAIDARSVLVAEAGTGVGKTFAYLVPALLSGQRVLVSTATGSNCDGGRPRPVRSRPVQ